MNQGETKRNQWRAWIAEWKASGKSAEQFGRERGVHASTVYWWRKELSKDLPATRVERRPTVNFVQVPLKAAVAAAVGRADAIEVVLRGERRVRVPEVFSTQTLQAVVRALEAIS